MIFRRDDVLGSKGIRSIYGKTGAESIPMLEKAISALGDDVDDSATTGTPQKATPNVPCTVCWRLQECVLTAYGTEIEGRRMDV